MQMWAHKRSSYSLPKRHGMLTLSVQQIQGEVMGKHDKKAPGKIQRTKSYKEDKS